MGEKDRNIQPDSLGKQEKTSKKITKVLKSVVDKIKEKSAVQWSLLSTYGKFATVVIVVFAMLFIVALLSEKTAAIVITVFQIVLATVAILMHKGIIKFEQNQLWLKWLVLAIAVLLTILNVMSYSWVGKKPTTTQEPSSENQHTEIHAEQIDWANIPLSHVLPEPQSDKMELFFSGEDWLSVTVYDISENDFLEYVSWCKEDYGFTIDSDFFDDYYYALNSEGYCLNLFYDKTSKELSINLDAPSEDKTGNSYMDTDEQQLYRDIRTEKSGFDSTTNEIYNLAGYTVEIPKYWWSEKTISNGIQRYAETSGKVAMLQITAQKESDDSYPVSFDGLMDDNENMISMLESTVFSEVVDYEVIDTGVVKGILYKGNIIDKDSGLSGYGEWFTFASEEDRNWCTLVMSQTDNTDFLYTDDFMKMILSIKPSQNNSETETATEPDSSTIVVTMSEEDFIGMLFTDAEAKLREMGFTTFEYKTLETKDINKPDDTIGAVEIKSWTFGKGDFGVGDTYETDAIVVLWYYVCDEPIPNTTIENDADFASLMRITDQTDTETIKRFINSHKGIVIEFDGCIAFMMKHNNYKTRFDVCIVGGNYDADRVYGPLFAFEDVNYYDMKVSGSDSVSQGMNFRITAEIEGFSDAGNYVILKPVSMVAR